MKRKQNHRRNALRQAAFEAVEPRLLFAYPPMTQISGADNPLNTFDVGLYATPALGDLDSDGDLDAVVGESLGTLLYYKNTGNATNPVYTPQTAGANPLNGRDVGNYAAPALADVDADGDLDAFLGTDSGTVAFFRNTGNASSPGFTPITGASNPLNTVAVGPYTVPAFGDVDGDGDLDAFVGENNGTLHYYKNFGTARSPQYFEQTSVFNPLDGVDLGVESKPALGDADGDGDLDAVVGERGGTLEYFKNTGSARSPIYVQQTGAANPYGSINTGPSSYPTPALGDVNGDGDLDLLVGVQQGTLLHLRNDAVPNILKFTLVSGASDPFNGLDIGSSSKPVVLDLDRDGDRDILVGEVDGTLKYFKNTGTSANPVYVQQTGAANPWGAIDVGEWAAPAFADVESDFDLDLLVGSADGTLRYFKNSGGFIEQTGSANPFNGIDVGSFSTPVFGDVNGDSFSIVNLPDVLVGSSDGTIRFFKNIGPVVDPSFVEQTGTANPWAGIDVGSYSAPTIVDLDSDADLDFVIGSIDGTLRYFKNVGKANVPYHVQQTGAADPFDGFSVGFESVPSLSDVDGDGDLDAVVGEQNGTLRYVRNDSASPRSLHHTAAGDLLFGGSPSKPALADLDRDGDLDALISDGGGTLWYFRNDGTATSPAYTQLFNAANPFNGIDVGAQAASTFGDLDADGDLDVIAGNMDGVLLYLRNNGTATAPGPFQGFSTGIDVGEVATPAFGDVDGDNDLDLVVGDIGGGLHYFRNVGTPTSSSHVEQFGNYNPLTGAGNPINGIDLGSWPTPVLGDVDSDGDLDLAVGAADGKVHYFRNTGTATAPAYAGIGNPFTAIDVTINSAPALGDLDGDGDLDVVVGVLSGGLPFFRANRGPVVANAIADQTFSGSGVLSYVVPADTFLDLDKDSMTFGATRVGGGALPAWLSFNPATRTFSGNPSPNDTSPLQIRVTANDGNGGNGFDDFQLTLTNVADNSTHVTTLTDENNGNADPSHGAGTSLREAINYANTLATNPEITFEPALFSGGPATITLGGTALTITNTLEISGPGADLLTINANNQSRVMNVSGGGNVWMSRLTIADGTADIGAGIYNNATNLNLRGMVFNANHASAFGGGIASPSGGEILINNSTFSNNTAGNEGAALEAQGLAGAASTVTLINSTISGNTANGSGFGAISNVASGGDANLIIQSSTIANNIGNSAGGVLNASNSGPATTTYINTIFNNGGPNIVNFGGTVTSLGHNLSSDNTGNLTADGDLPNTNPFLATLANNGGGTPTMALRPHSRAINAGTEIEGVFGDQRVVIRPQGFAWDIGAYEREATSAALTGITFDFETQQAVLFTFNGDASVTFSRNSYTLTNLTTGETMPSSLGTFGFNVLGRVATLALTNLLPDGDYRVTAGSSSFDFAVFAGDANRNRTINIGDFSIVASRFNQNGMYSQGDFNYDGVTNISDFATLASKFNTSLPSAAAPLDPLAFASQGSLSVSSGTVVFNTDTLQVSGGGAGVTNSNGVFQAQQPGQPSIAVFAFSNVSIGAGASISIVGNNPIAILSHGNVNIAPAINLSGANGATGSNAPATPSANNGQDGVSNTIMSSPGGAAPVAEFPGGKGGAGGVDNQTGQDGSQGNGGAPGGPGGPSSGQVLVVSSPGQPGVPGANGFNGAPGNGGTSAVLGGPSFFLTSGNDGGAGQSGSAGKGGGGGGGGGGGSRGVLPFIGNPDSGGGGGSGGNGGRGGGAGGAGVGGRAIEIGAVGFATLSSGISSNGGNGGNGGDRAIGSAGGTGGTGADSSGPGGNGGKGGNGGYGGPGGGGAGGIIFLHSAGTSVPTASVIGGNFATNNGNIVSSPGQAGMLKLTNVTEFDVAGYTPGTYSALNVAGRFEIDGTVSFDFASNSIATSLTTSATLDTFFSLNGGPVAFAEFADVVFTGRSPTNTYTITLNTDRTFSVNLEFGIGTSARPAADAPRSTVGQRSSFSAERITRGSDRNEIDEILV